MDLTKELYQSSKELNILYVEDENELRTQMEGMFVELFKSVDTAENGKVGLEKFKNRFETDEVPYDLVITDINMPEMDGIEMIHAIYKHKPLQPIIVVSAHNETEYLMQLLDLGINSFLIKPVKHKEFIVTLYKVVKAISNERLVQKHYKKIEALNLRLTKQSEALTKSNNDMHEKNIALEKSMRIIEGMQHKDRLNRKVNIPIKIAKTNKIKKDKLNPSQLCLKHIEDIISDIAQQYPNKQLREESLTKLSNAIKDYASSLPNEKMYINLNARLKELSAALLHRPECNSSQELERIFSMLESFFFIYTKWEQEWKNIEGDKFAIFSSSIENEILTLIDVWHCKI